MKILIIEDEYKLADAISEILKKEKFTTKIITNGEEEENDALTNIYDLILLDVMLPNKNGFEILNNIRKEKIDTPVIILTANVKKVQKHLQKTWKIEKRTFIRLKSLITKVLLFNAFKKLEKNNTKFYITAFSF